VDTRRIAAIAALLLLAAFPVLLVLLSFRAFPWGLVASGVVAVAAASAWAGVIRRGGERVAFLVVAGALLVSAVLLMLARGVLLETLLAVGCLVAVGAAAKRVFVVDVSLPPVEPPRRAVVIWNPRSGGGKAVSSNLAEEARARGIEPVELKPGDDLFLCSDGMYGKVPEKAIAKIFRKTRGIEDLCARLIEAANDNGGPDNITAVVGRAGLSGGKPGRSLSGTILMKPPAPNKG
jgi:hypothetical protein